MGAPRTRSTAAYTSNNPAQRKYAIDRGKRTIDIANALGCRDIVLWLAREGTYIREAKDPIAAAERILDAVNALLEYDKNIRILGEMKPNEPMDQAYLPTPGHFLALCYRTVDPSRSRRADRVGPLASWPASIRPTTWPTPCGTRSSGASTSTIRTA